MVRRRASSLNFPHDLRRLLCHQTFAPIETIQCRFLQVRCREYRNGVRAIPKVYERYETFMGEKFPDLEAKASNRDLPLISDVVPDHFLQISD